MKIVCIIVVTLAVSLSSCGCGVSKHMTPNHAVPQTDNANDDAEDDSVSHIIDSLIYVAKSQPKIAPLKGKNRIVLKNRFADNTNSCPVLTQDNFKKTKAVYVIKHDFDLEGRSVTIPAECALSFEGGSIRNGVIIGNNTYIAYSGTIFNGISIKGTWNVPTILSSMFGDATSKVNRLKDVIALTNPDVENTVCIEKGNYSLEVSYVTEHLLPLTSHTTVLLEGAIKVNGNSYPRYRIFSIKDANNVTIKGNGKIVGDRDLHTYTPEVPDPESKRGLNTTHEYGHGIQISNSTNVEISGISITKCIGDGICIIGTDVVCRNLDVSYCRRQGISVVGGEKISISDCRISHIWGSRKAGFGIDIEPDKSTASDITITNCDISTCNGGINFQCHAFESVKNVRISNCRLSTFAQDNIKEEGREQYRALMCFGARDCEVRSCFIEDSSTCLVYVEDAVNFAFKDNQLMGIGSRYGIILRKNRGIVTIDNNRIFMFESDSQKLSGSALANLHNAVVTDNEIHSEDLSVTGDTPCNNVVLRGNSINAQWESSFEVNGCTIENNHFTRKVSLNNVVESTVEGNTMQKLRVRHSEKSSIGSNKTTKQ